MSNIQPNKASLKL